MGNDITWQTTVVLLVAVRHEFDEVFDKLRKLGISDGRSAGPVSTFYLQHKDVLLRILLVKTPDPCQGGDAATWITTRLAEQYKPYSVIMVGFCAGNRGMLNYGDVVIASSTVRHDFGKLSNPKVKRRSASQPDRSLKFEHRFQPEKIHAGLSVRLGQHIKDNYSKRGRRRPFKVAFGVMSTGNQVVRMSGVFDYLAQRIARSLTGDEQDRTLTALEMEGHAVAYAANRSGIPLWLIVKGVSDYAGARKTDKYHALALDHAFDVTMDILTNVILERFREEPERESGEQAEKEAQVSFHSGDLVRAREAAKRAHGYGRRSATTRRRYLHALTQFGEYDAAKQAISEYRETRKLYDDVTVDVAATILWREGRYGDACKLLSAKAIQGRRQLLYLRAMSELFLKEGSGGPPSTHGKPGSAHIWSARRRLEEALRIDGNGAWWIRVNLFWTFRLLKARGAAQTKVFDDALESLRTASKNAPDAGTPRLYHLLLLAMANRRADFDTEVTAVAARSVQVALELLDMVYARLEILGRRGLLPDYPYYWAEMCRWLRQMRAVGRPVRDSTARLMR